MLYRYQKEERPLVAAKQWEKRERYNFGKIEEILDMPDLIEIQHKSHQWFLETGLREMFDDVSPIQDFTGNLVLEFMEYSFGEPKYEVEECKDRDVTYAAPLRVRVRLVNKETGEVKEQEVFMGDFPLMTEHGTFIINGSERVVVSQLVRSPGVYFNYTVDTSGKKLFSASIIPNRGAWLEFDTDSNDILWVRIDRTRKLPVTVLIRALGLGSDEAIRQAFHEAPGILATLEKDSTQSEADAMIEIYKRLRPGEPPTEESARGLFSTLFYEPKRYDLAGVGRYKINKKLRLTERLVGRVATENIVNPETGELFVEQGQKISRKQAEQIEKAGINAVVVTTREGEEVRLFSNDQPESDVTVITPADILSTVNYMVGLSYDIGTVDDIDHLGNRRLKSVGELLQNQFRIGLSRMERVVRERMTIQDVEVITPQALINIRPVVAAIKEFFGSSQLSQFMDQTNPLAELTHKRRLSALGPGGLTRERAGFEVRDVHYSHYGRMCPIETPEGPNIGLINSLSTFAKVNEYGFMETPYRKVDHESGRVTTQFDYLTADEEDNYVVAQANVILDDEGRFVEEDIICR